MCRRAHQDIPLDKSDAKFGLITLLYNRRKALRIPIVVAIPNHG